MLLESMQNNRISLNEVSLVLNKSILLALLFRINKELDDLSRPVYLE